MSKKHPTHNKRWTICQFAIEFRCTWTPTCWILNETPSFLLLCLLELPHIDWRSKRMEKKADFRKTRNEAKKSADYSFSLCSRSAAVGFVVIGLFRRVWCWVCAIFHATPPRCGHHVLLHVCCCRVSTEVVSYQHQPNAIELLSAVAFHSLDWLLLEGDQVENANSIFIFISAINTKEKCKKEKQ